MDARARTAHRVRGGPAVIVRRRARVTCGPGRSPATRRLHRRRQPSAASASSAKSARSAPSASARMLRVCAGATSSVSTQRSSPSARIGPIRAGIGSSVSTQRANTLARRARRLALSSGSRSHASMRRLRTRSRSSSQSRFSTRRGRAATQRPGASARARAPSRARVLRASSSRSSHGSSRGGGGACARTGVAGASRGASPRDLLGGGVGRGTGRRPSDRDRCGPWRRSRGGLAPRRANPARMRARARRWRPGVERCGAAVRLCGACVAGERLRGVFAMRRFRCAPSYLPEVGMRGAAGGGSEGAVTMPVGSGGAGPAGQRLEESWARGFGATARSALAPTWASGPGPRSVNSPCAIDPR